MSVEAVEASVAEGAAVFEEHAEAVEAAAAEGAAVLEEHVERVVLELVRDPSPSSRTGPLIKRTTDVAVSASVLMALLPLIELVSVLIRLDSPGPVFFRCDRVGRARRPLRMLKFRKMRDGATGLPLTLSDDERFTRMGRWLAKYKLDEIPQFWHVLRGEMSLVGPRPESEVFVECFARDYDRILEARPGIVGLSQLAFAEESRILDPVDRTADYIERILPQKVAMDRLYVENQSFALDMRIVFWSAVAVLLQRPVAVHRETGRLTMRRSRTRPVASPVQPLASDAGR